jgi:hypothetical protein
MPARLNSLGNPLTAAANSAMIPKDHRNGASPWTP